MKSLKQSLIFAFTTLLFSIAIGLYVGIVTNVIEEVPTHDLLP